MTTNIEQRVEGRTETFRNYLQALEETNLVTHFLEEYRKDQFDDLLIDVQARFLILGENSQGAYKQSALFEEFLARVVRDNFAEIAEEALKYMRQESEVRRAIFATALEEAEEP